MIVGFKSAHFAGPGWESVEAAVKALTSLIEPLLMVVLGAIIAFLVVAMYLPIFDMASVATGQ